jgi:ribonucleoside-diphosphate reductase alpha chain
MIYFEDVKDQTTEDYFNNNQFSIDAFNKKYRINKEETYVKALKRVCDYIASAELTDELKKYWSDRWFDEIYNNYWQPAGSIMQGAGVDKHISLMNCTFISLPDDSIEGIIKYNLYRVAKIAAYREGLGVDVSKLRPIGTHVNNSSNNSQGIIHWMKLIDSIGYYVGQSGRIPAMLLSVMCTHPDLEDFIKIKSDYTKIQNANISVQVLNKFYNAVLEDKNWIMKFEIPEIKIGQKIELNELWDDLRLADGKDEIGYFYISKTERKKEIIKKEKSAREILMLIAENMFKNAEPGIQNIDIARKYSNSDAVGFPIGGTNACSEQYLDNQGNCDLASIFCGKFFNKYSKYDKDKLKIIAISENRFLDNVITMQLHDKKYATFEQQRSLEYLRRTGAGLTDIVGLLLLNNLEYGSPEGNKLIEDFVDDYNYYLYSASIELGKERGSFKAFEKEKYLKSGFIKQLVKRHPELEFNTMRNVCVTSIAPTGTLSIMNRNMVLSYGIEPSFGIYYWKRARISGKYEYYFIVPKLVRDIFEENGYKIPINSDTIKDDWNGTKGKKIAKFIDENKDNVGIKFKSSTEINSLDKLDLMSKVQKNIDSSISVTYTLPENSKIEDVYNFILEAWKKEVKSIAAFPDKRMYGIISSISFKDLAFKLKAEGVIIHSQNFSDDELKELNLSDDAISISSAPERPKVLEADIYSITVKEQKFVIVIGLLNNVPYEIFGGHMNGLNFKFTNKKGKIEKIKSGIYKLDIGDDIIVDNFSEQFTPVEQIVFRLVSSNLRYGVSIKFIVEQLSKSMDDITSFTAAIVRVLKKYIKDGERADGKKCPVCGGTSLVYNEGCISCSCGWSKC